MSSARQLQAFFIYSLSAGIVDSETGIFQKLASLATFETLVLCATTNHVIRSKRNDVNMKNLVHSTVEIILFYFFGFLFPPFTARIHPWLCVASNYCDAPWSKRGSDLSNCFWFTTPQLVATSAVTGMDDFSFSLLVSLIELSYKKKAIWCIVEKQHRCSAHILQLQGSRFKAYRLRLPSQSFYTQCNYNRVQNH